MHFANIRFKPDVTHQGISDSFRRLFPGWLELKTIARSLLVFKYDLPINDGWLAEAEHENSLDSSIYCLCGVSVRAA